MQDALRNRLLFQADYTNRENLMTWLMTFQDKVLLLEPEELKEEMLEILERMLVQNRAAPGS